MINKIRLAIRNDLEASAETRQFGSGWISGFLALVASIAGLLLLLSQRYPQWFSMKELALIHNQTIFSFVIQSILVIAFLLALINLVLRRNKILGFSAITLVFASLLIGQLIDPQEQYIANAYALGFDWFVLNLLLTGLLFIPLEKLFGRLTDQPLFRSEWREDLFYFLISSVLVQIISFLSLSPSMFILETTGSWSGFRLLVAEQPLVLQVLEIMLLTDFVQYWFHRLFHEIPFLWRFHAVHHSAQKMDWLAGSRMHIVEIVGLRGLTIIPMFVLGFNQQALSIYILLVYLNATFVHANLRFNVEWLKPFIVTPRFHHWHHGIEKEAINVNYSIHFPWLDKLFGTYYMPPHQWPKGYGIGGHPVPNGYWKQFLYPFQKKKKTK
ncbi:MAG: sterol desaturase family protein [Cellvibrio sp.]|nr:sterol desaturase family protein [Cellvibrio sp.]